jgi:hypothetical protein
MFLKYLTREDLDICWTKFGELNPVEKNTTGLSGSLQSQFGKNVHVIEEMISRAKVAYSNSTGDSTEETVFIATKDMKGLKEPDTKTGKEMPVFVRFLLIVFLICLLSAN